ncbi:sulfite reductase, dissimilatory-type alpha subunit [Desulfotomaculum nigrificans CO-1-SRB]|uniref:Sulfite reductase, dissimilatory-type alpha subunit n=1 Tax=Desulfotomaculum nigrificans (strain DSM 14880 / VKM B-2319 / CO-1-SRB) TaxID=868595 RepID=F6B661_DESCC|nr:dissimilatory-type sulfite reductase subunit alpha [Desulfotomaculum nigrificans]AEF95484.1 sulfite reductase, dissimilatory-type alpha subunit [Desulfotomaculum nigrificans CO-1-SRB]
MTEAKKTPLLDELEKGPWPSFVTEIKKAAANSPSAQDLLGQLELSYEDKKGHWKHGGLVGVMGYGGGVIGRYSDIPEQFPNVEMFHTIRLNQPSGWYYNTKALRQICDLWEKYGSGLTNLHGSTGDLVLLGTRTENLQPFFDEVSNLEEHPFDLGGSGSNLRTPSCCAGPARCEFALIDTTDLCHDLTNEFQDYLHRPMWPYKSKIKISGCPNDCVASIARSDFSIQGTWRDDIKIDQEAVRAYVAEGFDIQGLVIDKCPTKCMSWDGNELTIDNANCTRCMHCINKMCKALRPGDDRGATILIGGKAPILQGAMMGWVIIPFMKLEPPYTELKEFLEKAWEWWDENGKTRERIGELILRLGMRNFLRAVGLEPVPQMVNAPRANPFFFWWPEETVQD